MRHPPEIIRNLKMGVAPAGIPGPKGGTLRQAEGRLWGARILAKLDLAHPAPAFFPIHIWATCLFPNAPAWIVSRAVLWQVQFGGIYLFEANVAYGQNRAIRSYTTPAPKF